MNNKYNLLLLSVCALALPGCSMVGVAAGAGATVGVAAVQEGGIGGAVDDARIQIQINDLWFRYSVEAFAKLDITVNRGRVLLTGVVQDPEQRVEAVRLAWQPEGVQQVINEIQVADSQGITGYARDVWLSTRLRTALTFDREVLSINYNIDTVQGTIYLMGFAQSRAELNRVIEVARGIPGVKGVVSYVKIVSGQENVPAWDDGRYANEKDLNNGQTAEDVQAQSRASAELENGYVNPATLPPRPLEPSETSSASVKQRQGIESEEIQWNQ